MSHLPFTLLAYFLNSVSVTVDKFLLTKHIPDPLIYVFYFSLVSLVALLLLPFTHIPPTTALVMASASTLLWTTGAYFMFKGLQVGQVSRVIPLIGTLIPIVLLLEALVAQTISVNEIWAILILVLGIVFLTINDWKGKISLQEVACIFASAILFAISYDVLYQAYKLDDFLTVFVWSRPILVVVGLMIVVIPRLRQKVFSTQNGPKINMFSKVGALFAFGQICGGISGLLLTYSVSLAKPALVNSLQGSQYVFLFLFSLFLSRKFPQIFTERSYKKALIAKVAGIILIAVGLYILAFGKTETESFNLGVTWSPRYATQLGLDSKSTYIEMLDELNPSTNAQDHGSIKVRIPVYWDEVEATRGAVDFKQVDYYVKEAARRKVDILLVIGYKQPRWPECFRPDWAKSLSRDEREEEVLRLVTAEVNHFKDEVQIKHWQVENEPLVEFGNCSKPDSRSEEFLKKEVALVKSLDPGRPILLTDSGELTLWYKTGLLADNFGTTIYRKVWSPFLGSINYPWPPIYYQAKAYLVKTFFAPQIKSFVVAELQAEPWPPAKVNLEDMSVAEQIKLFSARDMQKNIEFTKQIGFPDIYLWGVEWWYLMKQQGHPEYVNEFLKSAN